MFTPDPAICLLSSQPGMVGVTMAPILQIKKLKLTKVRTGSQDGLDGLAPEFMSFVPLPKCLIYECRLWNQDSSLGSTPYRLRDLEQVVKHLCASVSSSVKWAWWDAAGYVPGGQGVLRKCQPLCLSGPQSELRSDGWMCVVWVQ